MASEKERRILSALDSDEELLWSSQPSGTLLSPADRMLIPSSACILLLPGLLLYWALFLPSAHPTFRIVSGIIAALSAASGLYLVVGRFAVKALRRRRTYYGITQRRVVEVIDGQPARLRTASILGMDGISMYVRPDGTGAIQFGRHTPVGAIAPIHADLGLPIASPDKVPLAFHAVANVVAVSNLVVGLRAGLHPNAINGPR
jgi:hypothetical protein